MKWQRTILTIMLVINDVDLVYDHLGDCYTFYRDYHRRDSIDNEGMPLKAYVRVCFPEQPCPWPNAGWAGQPHYYLVFGEGFTTDDIAGHELTHGITEFESGLIYANESGAINESFSDMWGEWIDQTNGRGDDTEDVKWLIGEDLINHWKFTDGRRAIRNMKNPSQLPYCQPDRKGGDYWVNYEANPSRDNDWGGVHTNCSVGNKLCYLLTDGDTFRNYTVDPMGIPNVADLFYEVQIHLLTSAADYSDLYFALTQAAINLNWSFSEKENLDRACRAVEIHTEVIFEDTFPTIDIDQTKWTEITKYAKVNDEDIHTYSLDYSLALSGQVGSTLVSENVLGSVTSKKIDLSPYSKVYLTFYYQGFDEWFPDAESGLVVYYLDGLDWRTTKTITSGTADYEKVNVTFPPNALDSEFQFRISRHYYRAQGLEKISLGDWFVDDVKIEAAP